MDDAAMKSVEIKPNKDAFMYYAFAKSFLVSIFIFSIIILGLEIAKLFFDFLSPVSAWYFFVLFIVVNALEFYSRKVSYDKERYIFRDDRIIHHSGGIFSDREIELIVRNITNVHLILPYLENKIFSTGHVAIDSAGSGGIAITLQSIDKPKEAYDGIEDIMKQSGFALTRSKKIQEERPSIIGSLLEVMGLLFGLFIGGFFLFSYLGFGIFALLGALEGISNILFIILPLVVLLVLSLIIAWAVLRFLDLKNRVYTLYSDTITYKEGFLTKHYSFIPIENLADSSVTQDLLHRLIGIYDVKISCQGSGTEILFKNMENGKRLESNIDVLIKKTDNLIETKPDKLKAAGMEKQADAKHTAKKSLVAGFDRAFTGTYSMDYKRTLLPFLLFLPFAVIIFPLFFFWAIIFVQQAIKMIATKYNVKANSIQEEFDFITSKHVEFTLDKITGVVIKESFIDRWFGTCSITFWSIGSNENITLTNIKKKEGLYESVLAKAGIKKEKLMSRIESGFSFGAMLRKNLWLSVISGIVMAASVFLAVALSMLFVMIPLIIIIAYLIFYGYRKRYYQNSKAFFFESHMYFTKGLLINHTYYSLYNNIKDIETIRYPFSSKGSIKFNVAGEQMVKTSNNTQSIVSNSFMINYVDDIERQDEYIDKILCGLLGKVEEKEFSSKIHLSKPALANYVVPLLLLSWLIIPLLVLPFGIWAIKVRSYRIERYRVVFNSGILYKKQKSIIFDKVDFINTNRRFLNKVFHNGNVVINTAGSSTAELVIRNIPDFKKFYEILKENYR